MKIKDHFIYSLIDPRTNTPFYIGKTCKNPNIRLTSHLRCSRKDGKKSRVHSYIRSLYNKNLTPRVEIVEKCSKSKVNEREIFWIKLYRNITSLTNISDGGDGNSKGFKFKKRYVPPKGKIPPQLKPYIGMWKGRTRTKENIENFKKGMIGKYGRNPKKPIISIDIFTGKKKHFESGKSAAAYYKLTASQISSRCLGITREPIKNCLFRFKKDKRPVVLHKKQGIKRIAILRNKKTVKIFLSLSECARYYKIDRSTVFKWCKLKLFRFGLIWSFKDEIK